MDLKDLYQEIILDHGKNPRNLGKFENFNKDAKGHNPLCGDKVHVYLKVDENKKISDIKFEGHGCAISMASASIMTELMKDKDEKDVNELIEDFLKMIKDNPDLKSNLISEDDKTSLGVRIGVKSGGCAGMSYVMEYAKSQNPNDELVEEKGVKVFIDPGAVMYLLGTTMDFKEEEFSSSFVFNNPNETERCGCGESFKV